MSARADASRVFPAGFLWGAATSHHQVEGGAPTAVEPSDWTDWTHAPGHVVDGSHADEACGWWTGRAEEDLRLAASLGHSAHRMGISWARIEPAPGRFDASAIERYAAMLDAARAAGLATFVTLHHFTLPRWLAARGGFAEPEAIGHFARFAEHAVRALGDRVTAWATFNEPSVYAMMSYGGPRWPPGKGGLLAQLRVLGHLLEAHARAARAVRAAQPSARVGIVLNAPDFVPSRQRRRDRVVAWAQDHAFTGCVLEALATGVLRAPLALAPRRIEGLRESLDWVGLNYYGRFRVRFDLQKPALLFGAHVQPGTIRTEHVDWGEPAPDGLRSLLVRFSRALGVPTYVTENGVFDPTDLVRQRYLVDHVRAVHAAIEAGADVRGYFHWSLLDNFEWAEGYTTPFGLVAVDRSTGARTPRPSAYLYEQICRANAV